MSRSDWCSLGLFLGFLVCALGSAVLVVWSVQRRDWAALFLSGSMLGLAVGMAADAARS